MPRYTHKSGDWVEIEGVSEWPMRAFDVLDGSIADAATALKPVIKDWQFTVQGADVPVGDILGLPLKRWLWLRKQVYAAILDEQLDPEA